MRTELRNFKLIKTLKPNDLDTKAACLAMCLDYLGALIQNPTPFEYTKGWLSANLNNLETATEWVIAANSLGRLVRTRPITGFIAHTSVTKVKSHLNLGFPAIIPAVTSQIPFVILGYDELVRSFIIFNPASSRTQPYEVDYPTVYSLATNDTDGGMEVLFIERMGLDSRLVDDTKDKIMQNKLDYNPKTDSLEPIDIQELEEREKYESKKLA